MSENNFSKLYSTWATEDLLNIIDQANDYQPLAVEAARVELESRLLTSGEWESAKAVLKERLLEKEAQQQKIKNVENKLKSLGESFFNTFNPVQKEAPGTERHIKLISLFFILLFLYLLYKNFYLLKFMLEEEDSRWDFISWIEILPFFFLPVTIWLFWLRKKTGWIMATFFLSFKSAEIILIYTSVLNLQLTGNTALDTLFPSFPTSAYILTFLLFLGFTWVMTKKNIREVYHITKQNMIITISAGVLSVPSMAIIIL